MDYTMSGGQQIKGFAVCSKFANLPLKFKEGDTPYLKYKAQVGVLERIAIRRIRIDFYEKTFNVLYETYYDQHGARYESDELVNKQDAVALATAYYEKQKRKITKEVNKILDQ